MSGRHVDSTEDAELRAKIDQAKQRLPLPELMARLGLGDHAKKSARCPFHDDEHKSFSVFQGKGGFWFWKCHAGCGEGDEILFLRKLKGFSMTDAMSLYLDMAGFPARSRSKSHEYPKFPKSPESPSVLVSESPVFLVSPVSNGQTVGVHRLGGELHTELKTLAARNACTGSTPPDKNSWQLARDLKAVAKRIARRLSVIELMLTLHDWHRLSEPFLDADKTLDYYWMAFLAQLQKVRVPTGEGTVNEALEYVLKLAEADLPVMPGYGNASKPRKIAALHRELARRSKKKDKRYFLSYRDAAKVCEGLSHQEAHTITFALAQLGVIEIVRNGQPGLNSREAAEFRYLLSQTENGAEDDEGFDL
jgi:CHC2 zinc finger